MTPPLSRVYALSQPNNTLHVATDTYSNTAATECGKQHVISQLFVIVPDGLCAAISFCRDLGIDAELCKACEQNIGQPMRSSSIDAALAIVDQDAEKDWIGAAAKVLAAEVRRLEALVNDHAYSAEPNIPGENGSSETL